jgi:Methyltransferase domain
MDEYIFQANRADQELRRLRLIERALDEESIDRLRNTGIRPRWHCLELGAGAGSIAHWMGGIVGDGGQVTAVDINTCHIQHLSGPPYMIVEGDFLDVALDGECDVAHCRYVLIHNRQGESMLKRLCALIKPGGFLVVEEPDFTSAKLLGRSGDLSQQRVNNAICRLFEDLLLDPAYGLTLPEQVAGAGLHVVRVDARIHLTCGGSPLARMMGESTRALADRYVATREATHADIEQYLGNAANDRFWAVYYSTVSVTATKCP